MFSVLTTAKYSLIPVYNTALQCNNGGYPLTNTNTNSRGAWRKVSAFPSSGPNMLISICAHARASLNTTTVDNCAVSMKTKIKLTVDVLASFCVSPFENMQYFRLLLTLSSSQPQ